MTAIPMLALLLIALAYNIVVFGVYWLDKNAARRGAWRVSESALLLWALFAGSPGALSARKLLRHKTRKQPFAQRLNAIALLHAVLLAAAGIVLFAPDQTHRLMAGIGAAIG